MFCPQCKYEYRNNSRECPDCHVKLIEHLPLDDSEYDDFASIPFVPMPELPGKVYAEMVRGALENQNIPCYLRGDVMVDTFNVTGTSLAAQGVRVFVPKDRFDECVDIQRNMLDDI